MEILPLLLGCTASIPKGRRRGSPLLLKLFDNVLGREIEVDLGRLERVMPQQALERHRLPVSEGSLLEETMVDRFEDKNTAQLESYRLQDGVA